MNLYQKLKEHESRDRHTTVGTCLSVLHEVHPCEYCLSNYVRKDTQVDGWIPGHDL